MYKFISFLFILLLYTSLVVAQGHQRNISPEMRAKFEAQKISYITQQLDLSPEDAQQFWPLYNEMQRKNQTIHDEFRELFTSLKRDSLNLLESELSRISDRIADLKVEEAKMERDYHYKFKKVITAKQILDLHLAEKQFQRMLLRKLRGHGQGNGNRGRR